MAHLMNAVKNHHQILPQVSALTKAGDQPTKHSVEYIFTKPSWRVVKVKFLNLDVPISLNPYGHSVIRYTIDNNDVVMNICGLKEQKLVNLFDPTDYLFTDKIEGGNEQGGVFNRSFLGVRIDNLDIETSHKLHYYYFDLSLRHARGEVKFTLFSHLFLNPFRKWFGLIERGNCAYFTGKGLERAGIIKKTSSWPLFLWFKVLISQLAYNNHKNVNVISYRSVNYKSEPKGAFLRPFYGLLNGYHGLWHLDKLANITVKFDKESDEQYGYKIKQNNTAKDLWINFFKRFEKFI